MQRKARFGAPWGIWLYVITGFSLLLFLGSPVAILVAFLVDGHPPLNAFLWASITLAVSLVALVVAARGHLIRGYIVLHDYLIVQRLGPDIRYDLAELQSLEIDPKAMSWTYAMPNGGLFSFGGKGCRNRRLGHYEAYATDPRRSVVLRFSGRVVVITPDDPHALADAINAIKNLVKEAA